jgi:hypothetical protein
MKAKTKKDKYQKIMEKKIAVSPEELCSTYPGKIKLTLEEFVTYFQYCRNLQFEDKPDYIYLKSLFQNVCTKYDFDYDFKFDWTLSNETKSDVI